MNYGTGLSGSHTMADSLGFDASLTYWPGLITLYPPDLARLASCTWKGHGASHSLIYLWPGCVG